MIITREITVKTKGNCDITDLTLQVANHVVESGINKDAVTIFVTGSTAGVITIEYEPGLLADFKAMWERLAPQNINYRHMDNGYSHLRASILGASLVVPFSDKKLGTWQQIALVDFDNRPRSRQVIFQIIGE